MESRQVTLLTKAYLRGVLDLKKHRPGSLGAFKETHVLNQLEKEALLDYEKLVLQSHLQFSGSKDDQTRINKMIQQQLADDLPYLSPKSRINQPKVRSEEVSSLKAQLQEAKQIAQQQSAASKS